MGGRGKSHTRAHMCAHTHTRPAALPVRDHKDPALPHESSTGSWTSGLEDVRVRLGRAQTPSPAGDVASHRVSVLMHLPSVGLETETESAERCRCWVVSKTTRYFSHPREMLKKLSAHSIDRRRSLVG